MNRGFRVQFNSAIGPYKGGLRLHPSVNLGIIKFLGFGADLRRTASPRCPWAAARGGCDFDPKGKSDMEVMRFCQAFMTELFRRIGADTDVPAGDIGTGAREIGYMFGQYKKIKNVFEACSPARPFLRRSHAPYARTEPPATAWYLVEEYLKCNGDSFDGKTVCISGSGNVAIYATQKAQQLGAKVVTVSDSTGWVYDPASMSRCSRQALEVWSAAASPSTPPAARASSTTRAAACGLPPATSRCPAPPRTRCTWRTWRIS